MQGRVLFNVVLAADVFVIFYWKWTC